jgi:hypothetical protein
MRRIYATAGVGIEVLGYRDIGGTDATRFSVIDSAQELRELLTRTTSNTTTSLNLFFVRGISSSAGLEGAIGVAGSINGPPGIHGTIQSGVVAGWDTTRSPAGDLLAQVMAHECGHYLGLWHTRERLAACTSPMQSMCSPFGGVDPIADTPTDDRAMSNLMYYQTSGRNAALSAGQSVILRANALVR